MGTPRGDPLGALLVSAGLVLAGLGLVWLTGTTQALPSAGLDGPAAHLSTLAPTTTVFLPMVPVRAPFPDSYEPNDFPEQAYGPMLSGRLYLSYIWSAGDPDDYYHFTPAHGGSAHVELRGIPAGCDYDLCVYIFENSVYEPVACSSESGNADEVVDFPVTQRQYFVRVYPYSGFSNRQPYRLTASYP